EHWLVAGEGLASVLLTAAGLGLAVAFANQPLQLPQTRTDVAATFGVSYDLQQLLRVGFADVAPEQTPRRSLDEVSAPLSEPW
ncbi:MAG: NAD(P)H nitroreductase, partial [Actinomycetes bacterium]